MYTLSSEELKSIIDYINGDSDTTIDSDAADKLLRISFDLQKRLLRDTRQSRTKADRLAVKIGKLETTKKKRIEKQIENGDFENAGCDSIDVAKVIVQMMRRHDFFTTRKKTVLLLYECYASSASPV